MNSPRQRLTTATRLPDMRLTCLLSLCVLGLLGGELRAQQIAVYPPDINLETSRDRQSFVVQFTQPDGITRDVTAQAQVAFANPALVRLDKFYVYPVADGVTEMSVAFNGQTVKVPVKVVKAKEDRPVSFKQDVMPVFMRAGCNVGGCPG